jgi:Tfp pilus assembly protein PilN
MINLLPPDDRRQLRAARTNTLLLRYNLLLIGALVFLLLATGVVYFYLNTTRAIAEQLIKENDAKVGEYASVKQQADDFRSSLSTAKQILDQDVAYTKVILEISQLLPAGIVMDTLSLDAKTFGTSTTFAARAKDYDAALALKDSLQSSPLFSNVYFASISGDGGGEYPINVNLNVTIQKDAAK